MIPRPASHLAVAAGESAAGESAAGEGAVEESDESLVVSAVRVDEVAPIHADGTSPSARALSAVIVSRLVVLLSVSALGCSDNGALSLEIPSLKESDQVLNNLGTALSQASCS
jgi:hypothetical protein